MRSRRALLVWLVSLCGLVGGVFGAGAACAEVSHPFLTSFDGSETPAGSFGKAEGVAADSALGAVYVADAANNVVDEFKVNGAGEYKYVCQITGRVVPSASECAGVVGSATPAEGFSFEEPAALAVDNSGSASDPSAGDLYVIDRGHEVVDKFSPTGEYIGQLSEAGGSSLGELEGIAVDPSGELWVYLRHGVEPGEIAGFSNAVANQFVSSVGSQAEGFARPGFAVDSQGSFYAVHRGLEFVAKLNSSGEVLQQEIGESNENVIGVATDILSEDVYTDNGSQVSEVDSIGRQLGQFGSAQLSSGPGGVAVDTLVGTVYVANAATGRVFVFAATPGPRVSDRAASNVTATAATLNATIDPLGSDTTYQFEYGTTTDYGQTAPAAPVDAGSGTGAVPVSVAIGELQGGSTYHYRVVASNANGGPIHGSDRTFTTLPTPIISGASTTNLAGSSVDLNARINPRGLDTTYHFEYGTSAAYGTSAPVPDRDIGAGASDVAVSAHLSDLVAGTTYHWRVVAQSANGPVLGADHTFVYSTGGAGLPDNRAYEMVTPSHKGGALIGGIFLAIPPAIGEDGSHVVLSTVQCFGDATSCPARDGSVGTQYAFTRTGGGWSGGALAPPASQFFANAIWGVNPDVGTTLLAMPATSEGRYDWYARDADGSLHDIGPGSPPGVLGEDAFSGGSGSRLAATADLSHLVYDGDQWPFDASLTGAQTLYEYAGLGNTEPVLVGVSGGRGSTDLISECGTELGGSREPYDAISADGRTVFFTAIAQGRISCPSGSGVNAGVEVPSRELFARIDESRTVPVSVHSQLECTGGSGCLGSPPSDAGFVGASADGSKAFFLDTQRLTDSASEDSLHSDSAYGDRCARLNPSSVVGENGCNLYEYDFGRPAGRTLVAVSAGDTSGGGPRVQGVVAISSDGSHVYFVAKGVLTSVANDQGDAARDGAENLYVFERDASHPEGRVAFIASLAQADNEAWITGFFSYNVTPDGRFLVFTSHGALTADDSSSTGAAQVFRYDAQTGRLIRVSIGEDGFNDNGNAGLGDASIARPEAAGRLGPARADPTMSSDGSFVFFESPVALTPGALDDAQIGSDTRGEPSYAFNVYEYHEGHVYLLSDGRDVSKYQSPSCNYHESAVCLLGTDATGRNVFFTTGDALRPEDGDTAVDVYDARVCTASEPCIPPAVAAPTPCQGDACHGAPVGIPAAVGAGTVAFTGAGNLAAPATQAAKAKARKPTRRAHGKAKRKARRHRAKRHAGRSSGRRGHTSRTGGK